MVDIHISGVHFQVSDRIKARIADKLGTLDRYHGDLSRMHVTVRHDAKHGYQVAVEMHLPHGRDIIAHEREPSLHAAIDLVADKAAAQLRRLHEREVDRRKAG